MKYPQRFPNIFIGSICSQYFTELYGTIPLTSYTLPGRWLCRTSPLTTLRVVFAVMDAKLQWTQVPPCLQDLRPWLAVCRPDLRCETCARCVYLTHPCCRRKWRQRRRFWDVLGRPADRLHRPGQADCSNYDRLPNIGFKIGNKADLCPRCSTILHSASNSA